MGEVLYTVAKSKRLAKIAVEAVNEVLRSPECVELLGYDEGGFWLEGCKVVCAYTHFCGQGRVLARALTCALALAVGRKRTSFPGVLERKLDVPVPYINYGGMETWPIILGHETDNDLKCWVVDLHGIADFRLNRSSLMQVFMWPLSPKDKELPENAYELWREYREEEMPEDVFDKHFKASVEKFRAPVVSLMDRFNAILLKALV